MVSLGEFPEWALSPQLRIRRPTARELFQTIQLRWNCKEVSTAPKSAGTIDWLARLEKSKFPLFRHFLVLPFFRLSNLVPTSKYRVTRDFTPLFRCKLGSSYFSALRTT